ncbi:DsrH/TusB family sulfur relay protein [Spirabiliibacterium falconis]|uniref:DsrH/TusB family sulfur relay protein n=1 Tax=Spirabiliibacterium falconis TaxID=572023 RepID=UPI001AACC8A3|nr:DsrH/TusB family sulfur metabolism protein [Spirabiliibacterium falconis]MBE2895054.1 hypothetical protein [Spirabiliibacterium falconis]
MLYTFSKAHYNLDELTRILTQVSENDSIVLWQEGVLLPLKYRTLFTSLNVPLYALECDIHARHLTALYTSLPTIALMSLSKLVALSEQYHPQLAL